MSATETKTAPKADKVEAKLDFPRQVKKELWIKRTNIHIGLVGQPQEDCDLKIGSSFGKGRDVLRGLTPEEEKRFLPEIIGVQTNDVNWGKETKAYWSNISTRVPANGLKLEVGMSYELADDYVYDTEKAPVDTENKNRYNLKGTPINVYDYILWRYCLVYGRVANDEKDVRKSTNIAFFIYSRLEEVAQNKRNLEIKKKANRLFYDQMSDREWVNHVLSVLVASDRDAKVTVTHVSLMTEDEKDIMLMEDYVEKKPASFYAVATDKDLQMRAFIERAISEGELKRIPNTDTIVYETITIGSTTSNAIAWLRDVRNVDTLNLLRARLHLVPAQAEPNKKA